MNNQEKKEKKVINFKSCFDVIGPVMIGPSSSHTAGAISIGIVANKLFQTQPKKVIVKYYESFAETHKGHGTDYAIVSGILGFATDDSRVPNALEIAKEAGIDVEFIEMEGDSPVNHANTACVNLKDGDREIHVTGISVGGGTIEVKYIELDGFVIEPQGTLPILITITEDETVKSRLEAKLKENNIQVNTITRYQNGNKFLFQLDLNSQPSKVLREELLNLDSDSKIILL
ncbi:L-serine ammonia-lyase, iron-sulfur-dependent subunit beta [Vagococcus intermedius]|uniref:L-serine deaminase n=1 Tax=Vagococcus intermedius TaxID=2991418 RepID=A0AAF0CVD8_9ENTE|nr:L-serine ammonia-lyase, iron-sulfur-dependent subunit beta [Vagococcus intermedius]WEG73586.1 L-serine ammonia-lyase, iron-sulfur-dependent subunit beta [Vagococcus intermedius]WEG75669.1 L-serine ammonia-lyase, iron-sulfur-dependent subunit beta [Vagococcus intermedius]